MMELLESIKIDLLNDGLAVIVRVTVEGGNLIGERRIALPVIERHAQWIDRRAIYEEVKREMREADRW